MAIIANLKVWTALYLDSVFFFFILFGYSGYLRVCTVGYLESVLLSCLAILATPIVFTCSYLEYVLLSHLAILANPGHSLYILLAIWSIYYYVI